MRCNECGKRTSANGKGIIPFTRKALRLCVYCYNWKFPERPASDGPAVSWGSQRLLTPHQRYLHQKRAFEGMEALLWSPDFLKEWQEYLKALKKGEVRI